MSRDPERPLLDAIAVIGMAGRFPGAASVSSFWENLCAGVESVRFFTRDELQAAGVPPHQLDDPGYVAAKGWLDGADEFDAAFFGYLPAEAEMMDPQQRVFLECSYEALEDAGCDSSRYPGVIGVYAGQSVLTYGPLIGRLDPTESRYGGYPLRLGTDKDYLATRVAYKMNLRGPAMTVQTACSTSLVAVGQACQSLLSYQCDMALAGGVAIGLPLKSGHLHQEGGIYSPDGHCRPFDKRAAGTFNGDGAGVVVLKRYDDAVADGDTIHAVIRGFAINNDGDAKVGFTAPGPDGQAQVIEAALALAGISADTISFVEAHGTGTPLGDPIEIAGLTTAFRKSTKRSGFCAIGAVKSNVGHLDAAAGITGLIKAVLSVKHRQLPPTVHFTEPHPALELDGTPFFVNAWLRPLGTDHAPIRGGVSAFGLGGTNAHVILEEAPSLSRVPRTAAPAELLVLSAKTETALASMCGSLAAHLDTHVEVDLADCAHTLRSGRRQFAHRVAIVGRDRADAAARLRDPRSAYRATGVAVARSVVMLFPGGGAQYVNMGRGLLDHAPVFRAELDRCLDILGPSSGVRDALFPADARLEEAAMQLERASVGLPALFAVEYAIARQWMDWGVRPAALLGHSMGEYTAACLADVMSLDDSLALVLKRGQLFDRLPPGGMLAVPLSEGEVIPLLGPALSIAAVNAPRSCVVSGPPDALGRFQDALDAIEIECRRLHIAVAAHSSMVDEILPEFNRFVRSIALNAPAIPVISNVSGTWLSMEDATSANYWIRHLRQTVRFTDAMGTALGEPGRLLLESGPGALIGFARQHSSFSAGHVAQASLRRATEPGADLEFLMGAVGAAWTSGAAIDLAGLDTLRPVKRVPLPTYPFERKRFWPVAQAVKSSTGEANIDRKRSESETTSEDMVMIETARASGGRRQRILQKMLPILQSLSGTTMTDADAGRTFLELGFDSLFLGQASVAFQKAFGVRVRFRDFLEKAPTPHELAGLFDEKMPADAMPEPKGPDRAGPTRQTTAPPPSIAAPPPSTPAGAVGIDAGTAGSNASLIERIVAQQLQAFAEITRQQLAAAGASVPAMDLASSTVVDHRAPTTPLAQAGAPSEHPVEATSDRNTRPIKVFAPAVFQADSSVAWQKVESQPNGAMTARQQRGFEALVERYCGRTAQSKRFADEIRPALADPRGVVGFAPLWKETVYQIVSERTLGGRMWDIDGNEWLDVTLGFGAAAFGHSPAFVVDAVREQLARGIEVGVQSELAGRVATLFCELTGHERVCFCTAGTEAVMGALRLARAHTGRDRVAMFVGDTHGRIDEVLGRRVVVDDQISAMPAAAGIAPHAVKPTLFLDYGDPKSLEVLEQYASELAAVIVEPVRTRSPDLQPIEFLRALRELTRRHGIAFIMDEVVTGFRVHQGGAQRLLGIEPDLSTWGKAVAGGMPIGVISGKAEYMDALDGGAWRFGDDSVPEAAMTNFGGAGTFAKHPLSMAAALATLTHLKNAGPGLQEATAQKAERLVSTLNSYFKQQQLPIHLERFSSFWVPRVLGDRRFEPLLFVYLRDELVNIYADYPCFTCSANTDQDIDELIGRFKSAVQRMAADGFLSAPPGREGSFELTPGQTEIWLASRLGHASSAFNQTVRVELRGALDMDAVRAAIEQLVVRHEALRTTFARDGSHQIVRPAMHVPLERLSLSPGEAADDSAAIEQFIVHDSSTPFDLVEGPLLRATVLSVGEREHHLVLTVYHLVCDGWSLGLLVRDLSVLYSALATGRQPALPPAMPFSDYLKWMREPDQIEEEARSRDYWLAILGDSVPSLDLPADRPRPLQRSHEASSRSRVLDAAFVAALRQSVARQGCTLFSAALAAFNLLIHRLSGQADVLVGLATAGQAAVGEDNLVGHCVSLLPYRSTLDSTWPLSAYLQATKHGVIDAYDHQSCTYGSLIQAMSLPRDLSRPSLLSVIVTHETDTAGIAFAGLEHRIAGHLSPFSNFDLELYLTELPNGITVTFRYNTDLFDSATIDRWLGHYDRLLREMADNPATPVRAVSLLTSEERNEIVVDWNSTDSPIDTRCLFELVEGQVARTPDAPAIAFEGTRLSYAELNQRANRLAHWLRAHGVGAETVVAVCMERSVELVVALLGILKSGGAYAPLDPHYPPARLDLLLDDLNQPIVLTQARWIDRLPPGHHLALDVEQPEVRQQAGSNPNVISDSSNAAYVIYTSGSTGTPKGVVNIHRGVVNRLVWGQKTYPIGPGDRVLQKTPYTFDVSVWEFFWPLTTGACLVVARPEGHKDPRYLVDTIASERVTTMHFVPSMLRAFLDTPELARAATLARVICSGEALSAELRSLFFSRLPGVQLINLYGPTEASIEVTGWECRAEDPHGFVPIGRPIANTQIYILDAAREPVPIGVAGELYIGGAGVARGYWRRPELTADLFVADPFQPRGDARLYRTGDRARFRPGGVIEYLGRLDHQVKVRGFRIELAEIETALRAQPGVTDAVVTVHDNAPLGQRLVGYVVRTAAAPTPLDAIRQALQAVLPDYMIPAVLVDLDAIPLTTSGKIDRKALPSVEDRPEPLASLVPPRTAAEQLIAAVWTEVLQIDRISVHDDFFRLGGHSLLAIRLIDRLHQRSGVSLAPDDLFRHSTLAALARFVENKMPIPPAETAGRDVLIPMETGGAGSPFFWVHGVGGEMFSFMDLARAMAPERPVYGFAADWTSIPFAAPLTVEQMARHYVARLRKAQPDGPYHLGGFCSGAMIALEMARQLEAGGDSVGVLAVVDWLMHADEPRATPLQFLRALPQWIREDAIPSGARNLMGRLASRSRRVFNVGGRAADIRDRLGMWNFPDHQVPMLELHHDAVERYVPGPTAASVVLFMSRTTPLLTPSSVAHGDSWRPYAGGGLDVHVLPGSHTTVLKAGYAEMLAGELNRAIERREETLSYRDQSVSGEVVASPASVSA